MCRAWVLRATDTHCYFACEYGHPIKWYAFKDGHGEAFEADVTALHSFHMHRSERRTAVPDAPEDD